VIVYPSGFPIEVQLRTEWQHRWAEWSERLGDQYGRGIRYGDPPVSGGASAQAIVERLMRLSDLIAEAEECGDPPPPGMIGLALADSIISSLRVQRPER
jgi:hypothetical protein